MTKYIFQFLLFIISAAAVAQAPNNISYQAVLRKPDGSLAAQSKVSFKFSVHANTANGAVVYEETQSVTTNRDGLATLKIGSGTPTIGNFASINWASGLFFVRTKVDLTGGTNFILLSVSQFSSVPYAFYANEAGSIDYANIKNAPNVDSLKKSIDAEHAKQLALESKLDSVSTANAGHYIGEHFGGGIVFYVYDNGRHGLIAAEQFVQQIGWGKNGLATNATLDGVGAGLVNTERILRVDPTAPAAKYCYEYSVTDGGVLYADWYLPSFTELVLYCKNLSLVGILNIYWSSTEFTPDKALLVTLGSTNQPIITQRNAFKENPLIDLFSPIRVRPIRAF